MARPPKAARNVELYERTFVAAELSNAEAADAFGLCIGHLGAILTKEHQRRNPGTKRPAVPGQRRSYSNRPSADAQARNAENTTTATPTAEPTRRRSATALHSTLRRAA